jgi:shikimate dehydrogenase
MGLNAAYLAFEVEDLAAALAGIRGLGIRGISVTIPHKTRVIPLLDGLEEVAGKIQAVNTVVHRGGKLIGYNTDWLGALESLEKEIPLEGRKVLLLGAGGAARAIAFGLKERGAEVIIFNRSLERAESLASELRVDYRPLSSINQMRGEVLVNATSAGMHPQEGTSPVETKILREGMVVMDIVYQPLRTRLLREAEERGCRTINGLGMLARQGAAQTEIWTGKRPDIEPVMEDLRKALESKAGLNRFPRTGGTKKEVGSV